MNIPHGFTDEPYYPIKDGFRLAYALVWPRVSEGVPRSDWRACDNGPERPKYDRWTPVPVFISNIGVETLDGWIGWNWEILFHHPKPVEWKPSSVNLEEYWYSQLEKIIS